MKVQMTINEKQFPDHLWLDPANEDFDNDYGKTIGELDDGEPTHFYAPQFLNYLEWDNFQKLFQLMSYKLRKKGTVLIGGVDPYVISKKLVSRELHFKHYNEIIFPFYKNLIPLSECKKLLLDNNYNLIDINLDYKTYQYTILGEK